MDILLLHGQVMRLEILSYNQKCVLLAFGWHYGAADKWNKRRGLDWGFRTRADCHAIAMQC